ncbi:hypothetical protein [Streptomyces europaeiscabiei]|uniref:hypothetical protein n=1 Tax=Streptomyces europaeiscabiei TaxID=146819 RepID=UPI0029B5B4FC|nr:hypothetical protein [Streptomyces europaeiscabiei]MDX3617999.1 hypothetical protein [Streptomyces europaeiscabiei]
MAAPTTDGDEAPDAERRTPPAPDDVWHRFLTDSEHAIRETAPREPSARERGAGPWAELPSSPREGPRPEADLHPSRDEPVSQYEAEAVGELWQPTDAWPGPHWREQDRRARCRRVGRVLCTVAAITLVLGLFSRLMSSGSPYDGHDDTISQQSEQAPTGWPSAPAVTALPSG